MCCNASPMIHSHPPKPCVTGCRTAGNLPPPNRPTAVKRAYTGASVAAPILLVTFPPSQPHRAQAALAVASLPAVRHSPPWTTPSVGQAGDVGSQNGYVIGEAGPIPHGVQVPALGMAALREG